MHWQLQTCFMMLYVCRVSRYWKHGWNWQSIFAGAGKPWHGCARYINWWRRLQTCVHFSWWGFLSDGMHYWYLKWSLLQAECAVCIQACIWIWDLLRFCSTVRTSSLQGLIRLLPGFWNNLLLSLILIPTITNIVNLSLTSGQFHPILKESVQPLSHNQIIKYVVKRRLSDIASFTIGLLSSDQFALCVINLSKFSTFLSVT